MIGTVALAPTLFVRATHHPRAPTDATPSTAVANATVAAEEPERTPQTTIAPTPKPSFASFEERLGALEKNVANGGNVEEALSGGRSAIVAAGDASRDPMFVARLRRFGERVHAIDRARKLQPKLAKLAELAAELDVAPDSSTRARIESEYATIAASLPPIDRLDAMQRIAGKQRR
jgi:hypothetical protein